MLKSWMKEFYPIPADKVTQKREALRHSIRKWRGLLPENLAKHKVKCVNGDVVDRDLKSFAIDTESCALCCLYLAHNCVTRPACSACPIKQVTGRTCLAAYADWECTGDPTPMLKILRSTLAGYTKLKKHK